MIINYENTNDGFVEIYNSAHSAQCGVGAHPYPAAAMSSAALQRQIVIIAGDQVPVILERMGQLVIVAGSIAAADRLRETYRQGLDTVAIPTALLLADLLLPGFWPPLA